MEEIINLPNGFKSWIETHHEIVSFITLEYERDSINSKISKITESRGTGGLYELAEELTNEFETLTKGREWDGEYFEELEYFLSQKLK